MQLQEVPILSAAEYCGCLVSQLVKQHRFQTADVSGPSILLHEYVWCLFGWVGGGVLQINPSYPLIICTCVEQIVLFVV